MLWRSKSPDAVGLLTVYLALLFVLPSRLTVALLGSVGTPAALVALGCAVVWLWFQFSRSGPGRMVAQPSRRALFLVIAAMLASWTAGESRALSGDEAHASTIMMLLFLGWCGVALTVGDLVPSRDRLDVLLGRLALVAGLFAAFGILQFITGASYTEYIRVPGLTLNTALHSIETRNGLVRPASTALHPIEFGVTLATLLPICVHVATFHASRSGFRRWFPVVALAIALPITISRSAIIGVAIVFLTLVPSWPPLKRRVAIMLGAAVSVIVFATLPGVLGTLRELFFGIADDSSAQSRTDSYGLALHFIEQAPWFGRGFGTFLPKYRILDNQYLLLTIEAGVVGLLALLGLFVTTLVVLRLVRHRAADERIRDLAQSLFASIACASISYVFFDGFSFPLFTGVVFLVLGLSMALWRLQPNAPRWTHSPRRSRISIPHQ